MQLSRQFITDTVCPCRALESTNARVVMCCHARVAQRFLPQAGYTLFIYLYRFHLSLVEIFADARPPPPPLSDAEKFTSLTTVAAWSDAYYRTSTK
eukprot:5328912-Pyramimonas_sp.AAC.1